MIEIRKLSKSYGSKKVLFDINMQLAKSQVYGIVGKNGAGKTTLFNCLSGLETYDGEIISEYKNLKNHLGLLETNPIFMSRLTGWEYLKLLCIARGIKSDDFESQNIFELPLDEYAENYSTGMKKKLALLAVILQKNEIFILDEPFNGVDIQSNMIITEIIKELTRRGKMILISSHIFSTLTTSCDKIFLLDQGQLIKEVCPEQFSELEAEMKEDIIGNQISQLKF